MGINTYGATQNESRLYKATRALAELKSETGRLSQVSQKKSSSEKQITEISQEIVKNSEDKLKLINTKIEILEKKKASQKANIKKSIGDFDEDGRLKTPEKAQKKIDCINKKINKQINILKDQAQDLAKEMASATQELTKMRTHKHSDNPEKLAATLSTLNQINKEVANIRYKGEWSRSASINFLSNCTAPVYNALCCAGATMGYYASKVYNAMPSIGRSKIFEKDPDAEKPSTDAKLTGQKVAATQNQTPKR